MRHLGGGTGLPGGTEGRGSGGGMWDVGWIFVRRLGFELSLGHLERCAPLDS